MEMILNHRLVQYLETNHLLMDEQAGFRKHRSTEGQVHNSLRMDSRRSNIHWQSGSTLKRRLRRSGQKDSS